MTLYYTIVFFLLVAEMATLLFYVAPLPLGFRRKLFSLLSRSDVLSRLEYSLKILFVFVFILFLDSLNRMWRTQADIETRERLPDIRTDTNLHSKMFYNQRNMYLTGFTLFLSIVVARLHIIMVQMATREEEFERVKRDTAAQSTNQLKLQEVNEEHAREIAELKAQLDASEKRCLDAETLKRQADQLSAEYMRLTDEHDELKVSSQPIGMVAS
ncbi:B-cell receptor-associated 31-like protein [Thamnocephalis sphaerospora]|uniref:Endoplasmic reticulum transmembrane protein n=1 Tax=Thamnocephalis sphaerospora TaxID=78915 RepID=A0A4P9XM14_9FUNG|nr:B-cell receptor-associated 31-like protein [Thamnocephalis sphaerospora]RKP09896.1 B-cell receptor-associated 31-like protein [Thamnocephalis sphaerospora]|eukprot:RKP06876.1 B-cell receptor-associated 31-like protein [Thamnocephalis sphaerospora]